jgi:DNA polymerase III subunit epsilon
LGIQNELGGSSLFYNNFVALDFETANTQSDSACSIGIVRVEANRIVRKAVHLIKPPSQEFVFTYIHGLSWADVKTSPTFGELWPEIRSLFEEIDFIAAHNASFDRRVLMACCERYGIEPLNIPFQCTVALARKVWKIFPTKLSDVCRSLEIDLNHHEALSDALACAQIVLASQNMSKNYAKLQSL